MTNDNASTIDLRVEEMRKAWELPEALLGGTLAIREQAKTSNKWIPKHQGEDGEAHWDRVEVAYLDEAYADTLDRLCSKPFKEAARLLPEQGNDQKIEALAMDCDRQGTALHEFEKQLFRDQIHFGLGMAIVDQPALPKNRSAADEAQMEIRPYYVRIDPMGFIGYRTKRARTGQTILTQFRYTETAEVPEGDYGVTTVEVTVIWDCPEGQKATVRRIPVSRHKNLEVDESVIQTDFDSIPLTVQYGNRLGFLKARPALEGLAWLNLRHLQNVCAQEFILQTARLPILKRKGSLDEDKTKPVVFSARRVVDVDDDGDVSWLEIEGKGVEAGQANIESIEKRMEVHGTRPMLERTSITTATSAGINARNDSTDLEAWVRVAEIAGKQRLQLAYEWIGVDPPDDLAIDLSDDFDTSDGDGAAVDRVIVLFKEGLITRRVALEEVKRLNALGEDVDIEAVLVALGEDTEPDPV